ncbi:MAG: signal recognition particle protein, partial [Symbiobacteriaceae bacterium]|nr:signal recognition particle protein [Symbiobacteriaceae bacterium]
MFESLGTKLQEVFRKLRGKGRLTEQDIDLAMREVRVALLEADVNFRVVRDFINKVRAAAVGSDVLESLTPGQQVIKIVHDELVELLGGSQAKLMVASRPPTVLMMVGLQGSGKTTHAAKLANHMRQNGKRPLLVACDIYRPAAIEQLHVLGRSLNMPVFDMGAAKPAEIALKSLEVAQSQGRDTVILDTAGRLHIDDEMMQELIDIRSAAHPHEILLVVDAMTGQDAVNVAQSFQDKVGIDGIIMTKMDGDTRGGAALSVKAVTGKPIKFIGSGEKLDALEPFYPDRLASRILGMGDVLTLIEKAQANFDEAEAKRLEEKLRKNDLDLEDFLLQLQQMRNMGPLDQLLKMIPGMGAQLSDVQIDEKEMRRVEAIVLSMTKAERRRPEIINGSRRKRIAAGSGTRVQDVNKLLRDFEQTRKMLKQAQRMGGNLARGMGGTAPSAPSRNPLNPLQRRRRRG